MRGWRSGEGGKEEGGEQLVGGGREGGKAEVWGRSRDVSLQQRKSHIWKLSNEASDVILCLPLAWMLAGWLRLRSGLAALRAFVVFNEAPDNI